MRPLERLALALALLCLPGLSSARSDPGQGAMLAKTPATEGASAMRPLLLRHTTVEADISGFAAEVEVTQVFRNAEARPFDAVYEFPLPENALVQGFELAAGGRLARGRVRKRPAAGMHGRPGVFAQAVADIPPGKDITIWLSYVQLLKFERRAYAFAFPMTAGPGPGPAGERAGRDISIAVRLDAAMPLKEVASPSHQATVRLLGAGKAEVELDPYDSIPNRDFVVAYEPLDRPVHAAVLAHKSGAEGYLAVMLQPAADIPMAKVTPKELVLAIDLSGSMSGPPLELAKDLARHCLDQLNPADTFQLLPFSSGGRLVFDRPLANTPENLARGRLELDRLQAGDIGADMLEAFRAALEAPKEPGRLRIMLLMSDGFIGNDAQMLAFVKERLAGARVFTLELGASPNRLLLGELAAMGRGSVRYADPGDGPVRLRALIEDLQAAVAKPYITDLGVSWRGLEVLDLAPGLPPDLFAGRPVFLYGRYSKAGRGRLRLTGRLGGKSWRMRLDAALPDREEGRWSLGPLWAAARIAELERTLHLGETDEAAAEITRLALRHRLVSRHTYFGIEDSSPPGTGRQDAR